MMQQTAHNLIELRHLLLLFFLWPTSTKRQARKLELKQNNDHGVLLGVKCAQEGDRIPPLGRYRQSLKQEHHFSCVLGYYYYKQMLSLIHI